MADGRRRLMTFFLCHYALLLMGWLLQPARTLKRDTNLVHSCCQLCRVEAGATTRKGPQIPCLCGDKQRGERERRVKFS